VTLVLRYAARSVAAWYAPNNEDSRLRGARLLALATGWRHAAAKSHPSLVIAALAHL